MPSLFEIHITTTALDEPQLTGFVDFCSSIEAKPILIELPEGQQRQQPMISKVVELEDPQAIHPVLAALVAAFKAGGYPVERVKVEVPVAHKKAGTAAFPDFRGGYFEWHGKIEHPEPETLTGQASYMGCRLSRNALKSSPGTRLITHRGFGTRPSFEAKIEQVKSWLDKAAIPLIKEEAEYCVYDSNKSLDKKWLDIPEFTDQVWLNQRAYDAFLLRAAKVNGRFALKGSLAMRQLLPDPSMRIPGDLDFLYLDPIEQDNEHAGRIFSSWMIAITEMELDDGVVFSSFAKNDFWRGIDYAMNDDFPTVNTDLECTIDGQYHDLGGLDVSWNLPLDAPTISLDYRPINGDSFTFPHVVPLSLQIAWKLHQTAVRFRHKDIIDLILLLELPSCDEETIQQAYQAYINECHKDEIAPGLIIKYLDQDIRIKLMSLNPELPTWEEYRATHYSEVSKFREIKDWELHQRFNFPDIFKLMENYPQLPKEWTAFVEVLESFSAAMEAKGLSALLEQHRIPPPPKAAVAVPTEPAITPDEPKLSWWQRLFRQ